MHQTTARWTSVGGFGPARLAGTQGRSSNAIYLLASLSENIRAPALSPWFGWPI